MGLDSERVRHWTRGLLDIGSHTLAQTPGEGPSSLLQCLPEAQKKLRLGKVEISELPGKMVEGAIEWPGEKSSHSGMSIVC